MKPATIHTALHVALANDWPVNQLDVQNAFLHGNLKGTVYMFQALGYVDKTRPDFVCKLNRPIYGLKYVPRAWNSRFVEFITRQGFTPQSRSDTSLFVYSKQGLRAYLIFYVDDIILTASSTTLRQTIVLALKSEFPMTDERQIHSFLGISAKFTHQRFVLKSATICGRYIEAIRYERLQTMYHTNRYEVKT